MSCLLTLGKGAGTTSRVVSAQKEKLDTVVGSRIAQELKDGEFGGGSGMDSIVGRICHRQFLSKRQGCLL